MFKKWDKQSLYFGVKTQTLVFRVCSIPIPIPNLNPKARAQFTIQMFTLLQKYCLYSFSWLPNRKYKDYVYRKMLVQEYLKK